MTNRRVCVSLTFATDVPSTELLSKVISAVNYCDPGLQIDSASVSPFTMTDYDDDEPTVNDLKAEEFRSMITNACREARTDPSVGTDV